MEAALAEIRAGAVPALVVCHGGTIRCAFAAAHPDGLDAFHELDVPNATVMKLPLTSRRWQPLSWSASCSGCSWSRPRAPSSSPSGSSARTPVVERVFFGPYISPNGDGRKDTLRMRFDLPHSDDVTVSVVDESGDEVRRLLDDAPARRGHVPVIWDGRDGDGP